MISVDFTLFVQMANFVLLIFIMNAILYKPIRNILIERKKKIKSYEEDIDSSHRDAAENERAFDAKISEAKMVGFQKKEEFKQAGQEEEKRMINEIHEKAQAELETVRTQIAKDAEDVRGKLKAEVKAFSSAIAEKILGRAVS